MPVINISFEIEAMLCRKLENIPAEAVGFELNSEVAAILIGTSGAGVGRIEKQTGKTIFLIGNDNLGPYELKMIKSGSKEEVWEKVCPFHSGEECKVQVIDRHKERKKNGIGKLNGLIIEIIGAGHLVGEEVIIVIKETFPTFAIADIKNIAHV